MQDLLDQIKRRFSLSPEAEAHFRTLAQLRHFDKGTRLITEGQVVEKEYFVTAGCLRSYVLDKNGKEHTLQFAVRNWWISDYIAIHTGKRSTILVICTEQKDMEMQNGKRFSTGNHPVEALVPMLHLQAAGFDFEIATPTGRPVVFEMWAFPEKDAAVKEIYQRYQPKFDRPKSLRTMVANTLPDPTGYAAVFVPGGHGAMLGIPQDEHVGKVLDWAHQHDLFLISLCHGPGALLTTMLNGQPFRYKGYDMAVFPDSVDQQTPMIGYLPGKMPWGLSVKLEALGANIVNKKADDTVCRDRYLVTGASPLAADALGKLAAETLLG